MRWLLPFPVLSGFLFLMWLALQQSVSPGNLVLAAAVAVGAGQAMRALEPEPVRFRNPWRIPELVGVVVYDIVRSNLAVAWIALTQGPRLHTSAFMQIPLTLRNRNALAVLSVIITATPGTVWLEYDAEAEELLIHVLDLVDEAAWVETIKNRYERLLLEIFA